MHVNAIGHGKAVVAVAAKRRQDLEKELAEMKRGASDDVRCILNIVGNWAFGTSDVSDCLRAFDRLLERLRPQAISKQH